MPSRSIDVAALWREVAEHSPLAIAITRGEAHVLRYVNPAFCRLSGKRRDALLGRSFGEALPDSRANGLPVLLDRVYRSAVAECAADQAYSHPERGTVYWTYTVWPVPNGQGRPDGLLLQIVDSTERKLGEEALRSANQTSRIYSQLVEDSPDLIAVVDRQYVYRMVNPTYIHMLGKPAEQLVGHTVGEVFGEEAFQSRVRPNLDRCFAGESVHYEAWFTYPFARSRFLDVRFYPLHGDAEVTYAVVVARDITERKQVERLREEFLNLAAHELKTPLTTFRGIAQVLQRRGGHDEQERRLFRAIVAQGDRMAHLVQELVDVSQVQSGVLVLHTGRLDLCGLAREVVGETQAETSRHQLTLVCEGPIVIQADRERIGDVLFSLLDNAVKYSPHGGPIEVTVQTRPAEAIVCIRDQGIGIPREKQDELFQAFYQVAPMIRPTTGMGLGLYISREIIRRHGGRIWFESEEGRGSTFCFSLHLAVDGSKG